MDNNPNNRNNGQPPKKGPSATLIILIISIVLTLVFWQQYNAYKTSGEEEVSYDKFITMVDQKEVEKVEIYDEKIYFTPKEQSDITKDVTYYVVRTDDYGLVDRLAAADVKFSQIDEGGNAMIRTILSYVIMIAVFYIFMMLIMRSATKGGGIMGGVGKSNAKMYVQKKTGITFRDVAGEEEAKESLVELVDFLHQPEKYTAIGAKLPRGALLVGPPGTGKTLLAKAVAGEANVPFFSISGSEFVEMYVGVGASRVRDLFKQANQMAPCIIFIDEIDAIGRSRDTRHMGGDSEREQTLNQLLSEMDGFDTSKGLIVLAATNRPEVLDKALLRPGRFDRRVIVEKPDMKGREDIIRVHAKNVKLDETVNIHELALATSGAVGADLANIVNEAALLAVRKGRSLVSQKDLIESVEVVFAGKEKKDRILSKEEKSIVAYHETGHALLTTLQKHSMPVQRITIIPRTMGSLGYVWQVPEEEKYLETKAELEARIVVTMGGRAAEELKFNSVTTGAANDIEQATKIAKAMVTMYGMSDRFGMVQMEETTGQYLDNRSYYNCSDRTAAMVDEEIRLIIKRCYDKAIMLLKKNEKILDAVASFLVEHETITGEEFMDIFNQITKNQKAVYEVEEPSMKYPVRGSSSFSVKVSDAVDAKDAKALKKLEKAEKADKKAEKKAEKKAKKEKKEAKLKTILKGVKGKDKYKAYKEYEASDEYYGKFSMGDDDDDDDDDIIVGGNTEASSERVTPVAPTASDRPEDKAIFEKNSTYISNPETVTGSYRERKPEDYEPAAVEDEADETNETVLNEGVEAGSVDSQSSDASKDSEKVAMPWENYPTAEDKRSEAEENSEGNDSEEE